MFYLLYGTVRYGNLQSSFSRVNFGRKNYKLYVFPHPPTDIVPVSTFDTTPNKKIVYILCVS